MGHSVDTATIYVDAHGFRRLVVWVNKYRLASHHGRLADCQAAC